MKTRYAPLAGVTMIAMALPVTAATVTISYTYDDAGRLTQADYGGEAAIAYVYDANGNLLQRTVTGDGEVTYTLIYRAGTGGSIDGQPVVTQQVASGHSGAAVSAAASDAGALFRRWSDGVTDPTRTDTDIQADLDVRALFRSTGGADLDWYAAREIAPAQGETWADVDARPVPGKGTTLRFENLADTDPSDTSDIFRILSFDPGPPPVITFRPGSAERIYRLIGRADLMSGDWAPVPGAGPRRGQGEGDDREDALTDENDPPQGPFYRIEVELP